ncbi:hypothetical protein ACET3Z_007512 [Daucus carota]
MSIPVTKSLLSRMERESRSNEATKSSIWLQTTSGDIVEFEYDLAWYSPMICHKLDAGIGYSRGNPICVPPKVVPYALELIHDYLRFYEDFNEDPDRSDEFDLFADEFIKKDTPTLCKLGHAAKCLQVEELVDLICDGLAENIDKNSPKVKQDFLNYFEKCAEGEELEPHKNQKCGIRSRLSKKLLAKQTKELEEVDNVKKAEAEVEAQKHEDRSIDDLLSFINGEDKGTKGVQILKKKKKRNSYKGKEKKKTSSSSAISSSEASASKKVIENHEEEIHASDVANHGGSNADSLKLFGTEDESFKVKGDAADIDLDLVKMKEIDRQHEDTREVDDLVSFNNGGDEGICPLLDTKGVKTSKKKKTHKKRKEQKKTSSSSAASSIDAPTLKKIIEKHDEDINTSDFANGGSSSDTLKLLITRDESFYFEEDTFNIYVDPALKGKDDRLAC